MDEEKKAAEKDTTKRELLGLLQDSTLSPEEHKKILAIATSMDSLGTPSEAPEERKVLLSKALLVLAAILGIALLVGAWFTLNRLTKNVDDLRGSSRTQRSP